MQVSNDSFLVVEMDIFVSFDMQSFDMNTFTKKQRIVMDPFLDRIACVEWLH